MKASQLINILQEAVDQGHDLEVFAECDYDVVGEVEVCDVGSIGHDVWKEELPDGFIRLMYRPKEKECFELRIDERARV